MRFLMSVIVSLCLSNFTIADTATLLKPVTDLSEFSRSSTANQIQWNNHRPEQRRALNQFYQSVNQASVQAGQPQPSIQREQRVQQMRTMNPQQRQQMFLNYIQQNR